MLEQIDPKLKIEKEHYLQALPSLKTGLRELQQRAREAGIPIIILLEGWDTSGKGDAIQHVTEVLDPRGFEVHYIALPTEEELAFPWLRRFWVRLPHRGQFGIFERSWYTRVLQRRVEGQVSTRDWKRAYREINETERQLTDDGALIIKFWLHISEKEQRKRLKAAERNPFRRFTVTSEEWRRHAHYKDYFHAADEMIRRTSTPQAPWIVIEAGSKRFRRLKVLQEISRTVTERLEIYEEQQRLEPREPRKNGSSDNGNGANAQSPLGSVDLTLSLDRETYRQRMKDGQVRLSQLQQRAHHKGVPMAIVYEGWDAAGKGGNIRRMLATLDPRGYRVIPIGKPTAEELAHHYLWRFWKHAPHAGNIMIFDRSWYGRVLVERIEGFCTEREWRRAFQEIREFERHWLNSGVVVVKFWLHISPEEQLRRFTARAESPDKKWKLTDEDWRNREKWNRYVVAVDEMIRKTSTQKAPWTVIPGNCKLWARVQTIETVCEAYEAALARHDKK